MTSEDTTLPTGVKIKYDKNGNITSLKSPYDSVNTNMTVLRYYVQQIRELIK